MWQRNNKPLSTDKTESIHITQKIKKFNIWSDFFFCCCVYVHVHIRDVMCFMTFRLSPHVFEMRSKQKCTNRPGQLIIIGSDTKTKSGATTNRNSHACTYACTVISFSHHWRPMSCAEMTFDMQFLQLHFFPRASFLTASRVHLIRSVVGEPRSVSIHFQYVWLLVTRSNMILTWVDELSFALWTQTLNGDTKFVIESSRHIFRIIFVEYSFVSISKFIYFEITTNHKLRSRLTWCVHAVSQSVKQTSQSIEQTNK